MSISNIEKLRAATFAQSNYTQTVAQEKQEFFQDVVNERFSYASDYMVIKEESEIGTNKYNQVGARVTHAVSSGLTENFANEIKKIIFQYPSHEQYLGKMYQFNGAYWLTTNLNETTGASSHSLVRKCNNWLRWVNPQKPGETVSIPCVFTKEFTSTNFKDGSQGVIQISGDFVVLVQLNKATANISYNWRFVFNGHSFQVTQINNHLSSTYLILKMKEIDIQATDNTSANIANDVNAITEETELKILPSSAVKILKNESQTYSVHNYVGGVVGAHTFTITASGAPAWAYQLTINGGNEFTVKNLIECRVPLTITCEDNTTHETVAITITLGGLW